MDTRTGEIKILEDGKVANENSKMTLLTSEEYRDMFGLPQEERPAELALIRFIKKRKILGASVTPELKNAFRLGFQAGAASR